jgi:transcription termination/antitermination protein NusA
MNKDLIAIFEYLEREKGIKRELVVAAIEESLQVAARKSIHGASNVTVSIHPKTGNIEVHCDKEVVEKVKNPVQEISLKDAIELDPDAEIEQMLRVSITPKDFGRIAAQKARQIISQKLRGAERDVIYEEYRHRINQLISGSVKRIGKGTTVIVDLGKVEGVLPRRNFPSHEKFQVGDKVLALLQEVRDTDIGGAEVVLSRSNPEFVKQLLIQEVPELGDGTVTIEGIVREPGYRTKLIVRSSDPRVDPVGACIGMRGIRVKNIVRELNNEKIDIIPFSQDKTELLQQALSPVEIKSMQVTEDEEKGVHIFLIVDDEEYGTAIGKRGLNVRLVGELLGVHLEVQKMSDYHRINALERAGLATLEDTSLDEPLKSIEGVSSLVIDQLTTEGYTPRRLLEVPVEELAQVPGISLELASKITGKIVEQIKKQRRA